MLNEKGKKGPFGKTDPFGWDAKGLKGKGRIAEPMFGEPRSTIVALPKGATGPFDFHCSINPRSTAGLEPRAALQKRSRRENVALEITAMALKKWPFFCKN